MRYFEQMQYSQQKRADFSAKFNQCKLLKEGPYTVTNIRFSTPPYADGKPLSECPGWQGLSADYGHIDSITIEDGNGRLTTFDGDRIDKDNNLILEIDGKKMLYDIKKGMAQLSPEAKIAEGKKRQEEELKNSSHKGIRR